jgi:hypothetical protein
MEHSLTNGNINSNTNGWAAFKRNMMMTWPHGKGVREVGFLLSSADNPSEIVSARCSSSPWPSRRWALSSLFTMDMIVVE